jgi:UPF0716 protein FxsA
LLTYTKGREENMIFYLILLFTVIPVVELALLIHIGGYIGAWNTVAIVILTGTAGALLARAQGFSTLYRIRQDINSGIMPGDEILGGIIILCGGILFLTPGFITDAAGFFMLIPWTRKMVKKPLSQKIRRMVEEGGTSAFR